MLFIEKLAKLFAGQRVYYIYTHRNTKNRFRYGLKANTELSYFGIKALERAFPSVRFLKVVHEKARKIEAIRPSDIVIGHIGETFSRAASRTQRMIAFYPWTGHLDRVTRPLLNCITKEEEFAYWKKAKSIVLLTSEFNVRTYIETPTNFWYEAIAAFKKEGKRVLPVHQPLDFTLFPRIKTDYQTNNFLYVGNDAHMKGVEDAKKLVASCQRRLTLLGIGEKRLDNLDQDQIGKLASQADFFIQPGMWEAQCVSILEAAARGFIPIVTRDTGYPYDHPFLLKYGDFTYNKKKLELLLKTPSLERKQLADTLHAQFVEDSNHNSWDKLTDVLVQEVERLMC